PLSSHTAPLPLHDALPIFHCSYGSAFFSLNPLPVPLKNHLSVLISQLHQFFLSSLFRNGNPHFLSLFLFQPLADQFQVFHFFLEHDFFWNKGSPCIKLFQETG